MSHKREETAAACFQEIVPKNHLDVLHRINYVLTMKTRKSTKNIIESWLFLYKLQAKIATVQRNKVRMYLALRRRRTNKIDFDFYGDNME